MGILLAQALGIFSQIVTLIVLADVILSYFMDPYQPLRAFLDKLVEPLLAPIRRVVPLIGMMDFSPVVLIILVQFVSDLLQKLLLRL